MNTINELENSFPKDQGFYELKHINIVFDGDSIALGVGSSDNMSLASQVNGMFKIPLTMHVIAQGGRRLTSCLESFAEKIVPLYDEKAKNNVLFLKAGDNDVTGGINTKEIYKALIDYISLAHQQGWKVVVATNLQRYDIPTYLQEELSAFNALIRENVSKADEVVDFADDSMMGGVENRRNRLYYFDDEVHPSDGGYTVLASHVVRALSRLNTN